MITLDQLLRLTRLALRLGEVERVPRHPSGRRETDTTHSLMLALVAAEAARAQGLNVERAMVFALVHDLVEVYAGDVDTSLPLSTEERQAKDLAERRALYRLRGELEGLPLLQGALDGYEDGDSDEARLVHVLDKAMPKAVCLVGVEDAGHAPPDEARRLAAEGQAERLRQLAPGYQWLALHQLGDELRGRLWGVARG